MIKPENRILTSQTIIHGKKNKVLPAQSAEVIRQLKKEPVEE